MSAQQPPNVRAVQYWVVVSCCTTAPVLVRRTQMSVSDAQAESAPCKDSFAGSLCACVEGHPETVVTWRPAGRAP